jgi:S-adenosylmethionine-dependent methyltransferase
MSEIAPLFDRNAARWRLYTQSVKGRLLHELARHHLDQQLGSIREPMRVLDAGCGFGDMAFPLFDRAERLVLVDFSKKMIEGAKKRLAECYPATEQQRMTFVNAALEDLESWLPEGSFDLILCHNTLEYTEEPGAVLTSLVKRLAPRGILSLVAANCFSEAFKLAFAKFDLKGARLALHTRNLTADLFDHAPRRTFSFEELVGMAGDLKLKVVARHGIRIFADYLPENLVEDPGNFQLLFALEKQAASEPPYMHIGRHLQVICRK